MDIRHGPVPALRGRAIAPRNRRWLPCIRHHLFASAAGDDSRVKGSLIESLRHPATILAGLVLLVSLAGTGIAAMFPGNDGGPMGIHTPRQALAALCVRAGLVDSDGKPLVCWHSLRHTCSTLMFAAGVPLPDVSRQLRRADVAITAAVYGHSLGEDRLHAAVSTFDALEEIDTLRGDLAGVVPIGRNYRLAGGCQPASADF